MLYLYTMICGIEAREVIVEDEVRERDRHRNLDALDEVQATDRQEKDFARIEHALEDLRLLAARVADWDR